MSETKIVPPLPIDEFHGKGGAYVIENGVRKLAEEPTKTPEPRKPQAEASAKKGSK